MRFIRVLLVAVLAMTGLSAQAGDEQAIKRLTELLARRRP